MAENSNIAWTDHTFNPWIGCSKVSAGCANCYAETMATNRMGLHVWGPDAQRKVTGLSNWNKPRRWNRQVTADSPRSPRVFCASLCDVFEDHPTANAKRPALFDLIRETPKLDWLLLTKRPERIEQCLPRDWGYGWHHVWLGTSIENNDVVERADHLRRIPARAPRFVSYEPALGPIDQLDLSGIDWLICGGESGPGWRPMYHEWAVDACDRCREAGVAFFFKQSSGPRPGLLDTLQGERIQEFPRLRGGIARGPAIV